MNLEQIFSFFRDIPFWEKSSRKIIADLLNPNLRAVVVSYDNEKLSRLCSHKVNQAIVRPIFTLYDGDFLFQHCLHLDEKCDPRSRNVAISGFDTNVPKRMYLDLFKVFGTVNYFEFCIQGNIPKGRIEYARATSAFAAALCLQGTLSRETLVTVEIPLITGAAIGPVEKRTFTMTPCESCAPEIVLSLSPPGKTNGEMHATTNGFETQLSSLPSEFVENQLKGIDVAEMPMFSPHLTPCERYFAANGMDESPTILPFRFCENYSPLGFSQSLLPEKENFRSQCFLMCSMNSQFSDGGCMDWRSVPADDPKHGQMEKCTMGATSSFEISRKRAFRKHLSSELFDNSDKVKEESLKGFLQAAKMKCMFYRNAYKEAMFFSSIVRQGPFNALI